jgi:hypothetical protein
MKSRILLLASTIVAAGSAHADVCSSLQQQYLTAGGGGATAVRSAGDVASLNRSLQAAQSAAQANRCGYGGFFGGLFGAAPSPSCPAIMQEINRLQGQIRQAYSGGNGGFGTLMTFAEISPRDQIRGALVANGCAVPQGTSGGYRTLCVRACDGYYFPVENGVSSARFKADAETCQSMYGGTAGAAAAQLFVMPAEGDVADATPVDGGKRYGSQPYAFSYRKAFNPSCAAQLQTTTVASVAPTPARFAAPAPTSGVDTALASPTPPNAKLPPIPQQRPMQFEDPETLANAMGDITPGHVKMAQASTITRAGIRVVGADYFNLILDQQQLAGSPAAATAPSR